MYCVRLIQLLFITVCLFEQGYSGDNFLVPKYPSTFNAYLESAAINAKTIDDESLVVIYLFQYDTSIVFYNIIYTISEYFYDVWFIIADINKCGLANSSIFRTELIPTIYFRVVYYHSTKEEMCTNDMYDGWSYSDKGTLTKVDEVVSYINEYYYNRKINIVYVAIDDSYVNVKIKRFASQGKDLIVLIFVKRHDPGHDVIMRRFASNYSYAGFLKIDQFFCINTVVKYADNGNPGIPDDPTFIVLKSERVIKRIKTFDTGQLSDTLIHNKNSQANSVATPNDATNAKTTVVSEKWWQPSYKDIRIQWPFTII